MNLIVVESHQCALESWAKFRQGLSKAPRLISFDHHTDTSAPFRKHLIKTLGKDHPDVTPTRQKWLNEIDFRRPETVLNAQNKLSNDEHIVTAIQCDIISGAFVVAHNARDTDINTYREHRIVCRAVDPHPTTRTLERSDCDKVFESTFVSEMIQSFDDLLAQAGECNLTREPYVLDIDLDYLNTYQSVKPHDPSAIQKLASGTGLITIATEPDYVKSCALDQGISSEMLLVALKQILFC